MTGTHAFLPATLISGSTRLLGIVGHPISQVRSPTLWGALFHYNQINAVCVPYHVEPDDLGAFLAGIRAVQNLVGMLVTIPHKPAAARQAHLLTDRAQKVGTANLLRLTPDGRWEGDILDGHGFVQAMAASHLTPEGRRALVVGAGGAGSAIAFALAESGAEAVDVADVDPLRARTLSQRLAVLAGVRTAVVPAMGNGYDLIVNATPMGMRTGDPMPVDLTGVEASAFVGDVVISASPTPILKAAGEIGCHVQRGAAMTDHQVAASAAFLGFEQGDWSPAAIESLLGG